MKCPRCQFENPEDTHYCGKCATPLLSSKEFVFSQTETLQTPIKELTSGSTFGCRYQIIEELGHGGMGKVYRAIDNKLNEEVAIKLIKPEIARDKGTLERFQNELKIARKISHRNVGRMYELMEDQGLHFITMEYIPGEDLRSFLHRSKRLTIGTAVDIAKDVCEGLAEAYRLGVIHRDLKPSNIMIDKDGNARIMDFGIARSHLTKSLTGEGVIIGTPEYMSPGQAEAKEVEAGSDIYSLGVILYEMITGRVPFSGETPLSAAMKHKTGIPAQPGELNTQSPPALNRLIMRCLEKQSERRPQNATEVLSELAEIEAEISGSKIPPAERKPVPNAAREAFGEGDWARAEQYYLRSIELNPDFSYAHAWYGIMLSVLGRAEEAIREADRAIACDPLFSLEYAFKGVTLCGLGQTEQGREEIAQAIAMNPEQPMSYLFMGLAYILKDAVPGKAVEFLKKTVEFGFPFGLGLSGLAYAVAGQRQDADFEAVKILDFLPAQTLWVCKLNKKLTHFEYAIREGDFLNAVRRSYIKLPHFLVSPNLKSMSKGLFQ